MFYVNRLDARAWIAVLNRTIYVVLVFVLVELVLPRPAILGVALVASALASWFLTVRSSRRFLPWLRFAWVFDRTALRDLLWFGGWSLVSHGGGLLLLTADLLVVNAFLGTKAGGVYAAMREAPTMIRAFAASSLSVLTQPMAYTFATEGAVELFAYAQRSVRLMGLFLIPPVVVISGLAPDLLRLWLGKTFVPHAPLLIVMSLHLAICLAYTPLTSALLTVLHVRPIGMMTLACGLLNVVIAMVAVRTPLGMYGVAAASVLCWTILNVLVLPFLAARQFGQPVLRVLGPLRMLILLQGLGSGLGLLLSYAWPVGSWAGLVVRAVVVGVVALLASFLLLLMPAERHMALDTISRSVRLLARFNRS
jgi:O-antigen/teichoic acid export membrane protein